MNLHHGMIMVSCVISDVASVIVQGSSKKNDLPCAKGKCDFRSLQGDTAKNLAAQAPGKLSSNCNPKVCFFVSP